MTNDTSSFAYQLGLGETSLTLNLHRVLELVKIIKKVLHTVNTQRYLKSHVFDLFYFNLANDIEMKQDKILAYRVSKNQLT